MEEQVINPFEVKAEKAIDYMKIVDQIPKRYANSMQLFT